MKIHWASFVVVVADYATVVDLAVLLKNDRLVLSQLIGRGSTGKMVAVVDSGGLVAGTNQIDRTST